MSHPILPHVLVPLSPVAHVFGFPPAASVFFAHLHDARFSVEAVADATERMLEWLDEHQLDRPATRCSATVLNGTLSMLQRRLTTINWPMGGPYAPSADDQAWIGGKAFHHARFATLLAILQCRSRGDVPKELAAVNFHLRRAMFQPLAYIAGRDYDLANAAAEAVVWIERAQFTLRDADEVDAVEPDGLFPPRQLRIRRGVYKLTELQVKIWRFFEQSRARQLAEIMSRSDEAVWHELHSDEKTRKIRKAFSDFSTKLVAAGVSFHVVGNHVGNHVEKRTADV